MATSKEEPKKAPAPEYKVSFLQIFRYATWWEFMVTILGVILSFMSGFGVCYNLIQFGELSNALVERTSFQEGTSSRLLLLSLFGGGRILTNATYEENMQALIEDGIALAEGMLVTTVTCLILCIISVALINWSALKQITRIRTMFLSSVLRQNMSWYDTDTSFNLASRMSEDMMKLKDGMGEKIGIVSNLLGTASFCLVTSYLIGWKLALACSSVIPFSLVTSVMLSKYQTKSSVEEMNFFSKAGKQVEDVLKSIKTVVAFGGEEKEEKRYKRLLEPAEIYGRKRGLYSNMVSGFAWTMTFSINTIGMIYGTRLVLDNLTKPSEEREYTIGKMFSILFNVYVGTQNITFYIPHAESFAKAKAAAANIYKIIEREPTIDSMNTEGLTPRRVKGEIILEDIFFSYPSRPDVKILKNFALNIKAGEVVALVGASGCGKSTVLQLLQRMYDPIVGSVKLDGKDIKTLNLFWLRSCFGVVGQEPVLFKGTIHENIAIGAPEATRAEVEKVAEIAYAHEFICKLPNGYDTVIGERGATLSGGQKQRIAIARSLLREPAVLLLDEPTSALDSHSEKKVQAALDRASTGRTTIVVSHRLSTIVKADKIICMDQGAIVEQGTHQELLAKKGVYWNLVLTGNEAKEPDVIESVAEASNDEIIVIENNINNCNQRRNRASRRRQSVPREPHNWIIPRGSITSISAGLQNTVYNCDSDDSLQTSSNKDVKSVSQLDLLKLNAPEWPLLVTGSMAALLLGSAYPALSLLFGYIISIYALTDQEEILRQCDFLSGLVLLVALVAGICMWTQGATFTSSGLKMTTRLRMQCFSSLLRQEIGFYDHKDNTVGALCARLSGDAAEVQGVTGVCIGIIIQGVSSVVIGFLMALSYSWKMTLVGMAFMPLMVGSIWLEGIISQKSLSDERAAMEAAAAVATEAVISVRTVQSLGVEHVFIKKFQEEMDKAVICINKKSKWRGLVLGIGLNVPFMAFCSAIAYGTSLVAYEGMDYKDVLLVNEAIMYGAYMLGQSLVMAPNFTSAKACGSRIIAMIKRTPKINTAEGVTDSTWEATGNFNIKGLEFSYPGRPLHKVLKNINLKVDQGKMIALVGSSGCGKSTIVQLLQRFYDPDSGNIELDGKDIHTSLSLPCLRRQLGVVQQEPVLFDRTLGENIAYGDNGRKVTMQEIIAAAKAANIHNFITALPKGYDTPLGSGGAQLSGGQKQRICIARALIRSPRLLLLDEATSALDANSEKVVSEAIEKAAQGRTCISIAHRLSTIKKADLICVMEKGEIVEQGTHSELIGQRGHYWRMSKSQHVD